MSRANAWAARTLWGVTLTTERDGPMLLGSLWSHHKPTPYPGEPTRALLFCNRQQARDWCAAKQAGNKQLGWKFRAVRVTESVRPSP